MIELPVVEHQTHKQRHCAVHSTRENTVKIRVWVGKSRIAGRGLFTAQDIKKGKRIIQYIGPKIAKEEGSRRAQAGNAYIFRTE
jgi:SET domain-containing protein